MCPDASRVGKLKVFWDRLLSAKKIETILLGR